LEVPKALMATDEGSPPRSYDRNWDEIEGMLDLAEERAAEWRKWFEECRDKSDREGMMEAARNFKALDGVIKCLKWVLGEQGVNHPLE
jgi:hypothetical protein